MAELDYDALQRLADAATEGPWQWTREPGDEEGSLEAPSEEGYVLGVYGMHTEGFIAVGKADAEFIAASRQAIPALLDRVRELVAERDAALSTIAKVREILAHDEIEGWEHDEWVYRQEGDRKLSEIEAALGSVPSTGEGDE